MQEKKKMEDKEENRERQEEEEEGWEEDIEKALGTSWDSCSNFCFISRPIIRGLDCDVK